MTQQYKELRNIAIIAHVDHGKTTLVDRLLRYGQAASTAVEVDRVMDSMDLERERGITISAKNCAVYWKDYKINILDTPGHADFGGEVERALYMVDGAILLVDAAEGPLPQTRFVLAKALQLGLSIVVVINKIDRKDARPKEVLDEVYELFFELEASEEQIDFPVIYCVGKLGLSSRDLDETGKDLTPLLETIVETVPSPRQRDALTMVAPLQFLVCNLGYSDYLGRLAIGKVIGGTVRDKDNLVCCKKGEEKLPLKLSSLQVYHGMGYQVAKEVTAGEIAIMSGIEEVEIGDTICEKNNPLPLVRLRVDEPTVSMTFTVNPSPLSGREGEYVQSRKILERLEKEMLLNVSLRLIQTETDVLTVLGRGEFQMAILIEMMRREGYEFAVGKPKVIIKELNGEMHEPIEDLIIDCPDVYTGVLTEKLAIRKGRMTNMILRESGRVRLEFSIPTRGLIGFRSEFLTDTRGMGIMNTVFNGFEPYRGDFVSRQTGSLVADRPGEAVAYGLFHLEPRGSLFVVPGDPVYAGMIIGEHNRENDLSVNACKAKKLSNMRAAGKDDNIILSPVQTMTIERAIEFIRDDEMVEVTPKNIRMFKKGFRANI